MAMNRKLFLIIPLLLMIPNCADAQGFLNKIGKALDKVGKVIDQLPTESSSNQKTTQMPAKQTRQASTIKQGSTTINPGHIGLDIKIVSCEAFGNKVMLNLMLYNSTNESIPINMRNYSSEAFDDEGNKYSGGDIRMRVGFDNLGDGFGFNLPSDVKAKVRIQISGIPESIKEIKSLKIDTYPQTDKNIIIRNLPISREGDE